MVWENINTEWEECVTGQGSSFGFLTSFPESYSQTLYSVWLSASHPQHTVVLHPKNEESEQFTSEEV